MRRPVGGDDEARGPRQGANLSIPNLITLGRILLVPVVVWAITAGELRIAFVLFLAAGISDAVDGFLAKRFGMATELGAYLDPLADKAMLVSKLNTVAQIVLALVVMAALGFHFNADIAVLALTALVAALTLLSIGFYV